MSIKRTSVEWNLSRMCFQRKRQLSYSGCAKTKQQQIWDMFVHVLNPVTHFTASDGLLLFEAINEACRLWAGVGLLRGGIGGSNIKGEGGGVIRAARTRQ